MASLRKRKTDSGVYWIVDYRFKDGGKSRRRQKHFQDRSEAELYLAEIERQLTRARHGRLDVPLAPPNASVVEWLDRFLAAVQPNCSETYHRIMRYTVQSFAEFLADRGVTMTRELQREHLSAYVKNERSRGLKPKSIANNLQIVKRATKWGADEGLLSERLLKSFPRVKVPRRKRRVLSDAEVEAVLDLFDGDPLYPVVLTALYTGARRGELVQLRCSDVDVPGRVLTLPAEITKSGVERSVQIHDRLLPVLEALVRGREGALFTRKGKPLRADYVTRRFSEVLDAAKRDFRNVSFHNLRHTCATRLAAAGMNPFDVQRVMGHASITTTMIYVNLARQRVPDMNIME